jgi:nucleoside-diphosphate-sugar epimerase
MITQQPSTTMPQASMQSQARTAVLGGSGVAGTGIVGALVEAGEHVDVFDLRPPMLSDPRVRFIEADLRDPAVIGRIAAYEHVVVAFGLLARGLAEQPAAAFEFNFDVSLQVLAAARRGRCRRFVFLSSAMVYDRVRGVGALDEAAPVVGSCLYTHSKLALEHALCCAVAAGLAPTLVLRPFTLFGPGPLRGEAGHLVGRWLELVGSGEALTMHGDGEQTVDLVPSSVLGAACVRFFAESDPPPLRVLNGTCGQPMTIRALAEHFCRRFPAATVRSVPAPPLATAASRTWGDPRALQDYLGAPLPDPSVAMRAVLEQCR